MEKNSIAIFNSNDELPTNGDPVVQIQTEFRSVLVNRHRAGRYHAGFIPDNPDPKYREVLVLVRPNELKENGMATVSGPMKEHPSPASKRFSENRFSGRCCRPDPPADAIYLNTNENDRKTNWACT